MNENNDLYLCSKCGKNSSSFKNFKYFVNHACSGKSSVCKICNYSFSSDKVLSVHLEEVSITRKRRHKKIHKKEVLYSCGKCEKTFSRTEYKKTHEFNSKGKDKAKFTCDTCSKAFPRQDRLTNHKCAPHKATEEIHKCVPNVIKNTNKKMNYSQKTTSTQLTQTQLNHLS